MSDEPTLPSSERPEPAPSTDRGGHGPLTTTEETLQHFVELVRGAVGTDVRAAVKDEMAAHAAEELTHHKRVEGTMEQVLRHVYHALDRIGRIETRQDEHDKRLMRLEHPEVDFDAEPGSGGA